jgi:hypothetical protein
MSNLQPSPLEGITIEHPDVPCSLMIINKSDFDPTIHKPYEPPATEAPKPEGDQKPGAGENPNGPKQEGGSNQKPPAASKAKDKSEK